MNNTNHYSPDDKDNRVEDLGFNGKHRGHAPCTRSWRTRTTGMRNRATLPRCTGQPAAEASGLPHATCPHLCQLYCTVPSFKECYTCYE